MTSVLLSIVGVLVGGIITWLVARAYYEKASGDLDRAAEDLRQETKRVRGRLLDLFAALDEAGLIEVEWKESGDDIRGVVIRREIGLFATPLRAEQEPDRSAGRGPEKPWWKRVFGG